MVLGPNATVRGRIWRATRQWLFLARYLRDPQAVKPGVYMPAVQLTAAELGDIVAYMESLK